MRWFFLAVLLAGCSRAPKPEPAPVPAAVAPAADRFAVVELFTSEGCSSCPPADENLMELAESGRAVHALSFHVDYWNYLGWKDPFSDAAYSERQRKYAGALSGGRVYTPQMVVNGSEELLGSNRGRARAAIERALASEPELAIELGLERSADAVTVRWKLSEARVVVLNLALVKGAREIAVSRGENAGETLAHANVVRAFSSELTGAAHGSERLALPSGMTADGAAVIAYAQHPESLRVIGARAASL